MAAANDRSSNLGAALRADLLSARSGAAQVAYGEELSEEDVWGGGEEEATETEDREPPAGSAGFGDSGLPAGRIISRAGWDTTSSPFMSLKGLSALAAEGSLTRSGQGPGGAGGGAGDIIGPASNRRLLDSGDAHAAVTNTPSLLIPRLPARHEAAKSIVPRRASAPVNVPDWSKVTGSSHRPSNTSLADDEEEGGGIVPPHELVARECAKSVSFSFSVREGVGRTLRGRDLDHVRTAVLRKTGFLDS